MLLGGGRALLLLHLRPDLPQPDGLVRGHARHRGVVRAGGQQQHAAGVARQVGHLEQRLGHVAGILPDGQLVVAEAVAGDELAVLGAPGDAGHLAAGVAAEHLRHGRRVPQPHGPVHRAARRGQHVGLPGTPGHRLKQETHILR